MGLFNFLNVRLYSGNLAGVWQIAQTWIKKGQHGYICVVNAHSLAQGYLHSAVQRSLTQADLGVPDGMPLVWAGRLLGWRSTQRIYGPNLFLYFCRQAEKWGYRIFLYGATRKTLDLLQENLRKRFPRLLIAGSYAPPFRRLTPAEEQHIRSVINQAKPQIVWVGLSTPKQELWMRRNSPDLAANVLVGVGAAFDFFAGTVRQAPGWIQHTGFEWLFRFVQEPQRLWRRYLVGNAIFLFLVAGFFIKRLFGLVKDK